MTPKVLVKEIRMSKEYLDRSTQVLQESDSTFSPVEGAFTVAQQMAHIAQTVEWFIDGAFGKGFDMDFENHNKMINFTSLAKAREWVDSAYGRLIATIESKSPEELLAPIEGQPILNGEPKLTIVFGIIEHTAHHRGALTMYSRMRGHTPLMPYMDPASVQA